MNHEAIRPAALAKGRLLGLSGLAGAGIFFVTITALHIVQPYVRPAYDFVSNYANGPYGLFFSLSLLVHGVANVGIAVGLSIAINDSKLARCGIALFIVSSIAMSLAAIFPIDPVASERTVRGIIHLFATGSGLIAELAALICIGKAHFMEFSWNRYARLTVIFAFFAASSIVWLMVAILIGGGFPGLAERAALGSFFAWEIVSAYLLVKNTAHCQQSGSR